MLTSGDWAQMAADLDRVRGDNQVSVAIRRGSTTLAAQTVRIAGTGHGQEKQGQAAQQASGPVVVLGSTSLDIQNGDRFTTGGVLYEVVFVRPNRRAGVVAEAKVVE